MSKFRAVFYPATDVWFCAEFTGDALATKEAAMLQLSIIADYTLFLHDTTLMLDRSNCGLVQELVDGEWCDCEEEEGEDEKVI